MGNCFIYGLVDPDALEMRYVGKTSVGLAEPIGYILKSRQLLRDGKSSRRRVHNWIKKLIENHQEPLITIIEYCSKEELNALEIGWIRYFREIGCRLTNMTDGGDGGRREKSLEERQKLSRSLKGKKKSPATVAAHAASLRGKKMPQTSGLNHWTARVGHGPNKGKKFSVEHRQKLSEVHKGKVPWNKGRRG